MSCNASDETKFSPGNSSITFHYLVFILVVNVIYIGEILFFEIHVALATWHRFIF